MKVNNKLLKLLVISLPVISLMGCKDSARYTVASSKDMNVYVNPYTPIGKKTAITYFKEEKDIPYISLKDAYSLHDQILQINAVNIKAEVDHNIVKEKNSITTYNAEKDTITFSDMYLSLSGRPELLADYSTIDNGNGQTFLVGHSSKNCYIDKKQPKVVLDLSKYNIDIIDYKDEIYIPFQTYSDIFFSFLYVPLYVGKTCIFNAYQMPRTERDCLEITDALLDFNYRETCFFLDTHYGLKKEHSISSFDTYFKALGLDTRMRKGVNYVDDAIAQLTEQHFADLHSGFRSASPASSSSVGSYINDTRIARTNHQIALMNELSKHREYAQNYVEIDDTVILTFTSFDTPSPNEYSYSLSDGSSFNTLFQLFRYVYDRFEENDSLENLIVDISLNGGGDAITLAYIASMLVGNEIFMPAKFTIDDSIIHSYYLADCNFDNVLDKSDRLLANKNVYILQSEVSFSCGNALPNYVKDYDNITLVGHRSGGGSNVVLPSTNVFGTSYQVSGPIQLVTNSNGSYYSVDQGVEPDIYADYSTFYDRPALIELIKSF